METLAHRFDQWRIIPRLLMVTMLISTYRVVEWYMGLPEPSTQQTSLVSIMTAMLSTSFGLFLGSGRKE
ncbi:MAG TPA: hypothetical protein DCW74_06620 [Alteromonas australica]|uniref:Uncharacterized protein n=1 Tax=Alteromonas australica TaxID=589873 RepID=A0A350P277_9ALTE|nr:hypothetical protein [Alteromonas australica]